MRGSSLSTIRTCVERLASGWPTASEPRFVSWGPRYTRCPGCAADLVAHAQATALAAAVAGRAPGDPPPSLVFYATDELTTCPTCGAPLPA